MLEIQNVLVPTDFSECSNKALAYARAIAHAFGARLHVLHVAEPVMADFVSLGAMPPGAPDRTAERRRLKESVTLDDHQTLRAKTVFVESGSPDDAVVEYAKTRHMDLVVMGTHGRKGLASALLGSIAEKIVRAAPCPVLTVREHERDFLAPDMLVPLATDQGQNE